MNGVLPDQGGDAADPAHGHLLAHRVATALAAGTVLLAAGLAVVLALVVPAERTQRAART